MLQSSSWRNSKPSTAAAAAAAKVVLALLISSSIHSYSVGAAASSTSCRAASAFLVTREHVRHQNQHECQQRRCLLPLSFVDSSLRSSIGSNEGNDDDDDVLNRLIGRRDQIKRKKTDAEKLIEAQAKAAALEPTTVDLDLDKLPEFKTKRPVRNQPGTDSDGESDQDGGKDSEKDSKSSKMDADIVDFKADYEDENDLHIPNRIGISTIAWGDKSRNFRSLPAGKKLTKRMVKAGYFVAGDLQLAYSELMLAGVTLFETSPAYGASSINEKLSAEHILQRCIAEQQDSDVGLPEPMLMEGMGGNSRALWKRTLLSLGRPSTSLTNTLEDSCTTVGSNIVDLYQVPTGGPVFPTRLLADGLAAVIESGCANHVGVLGMTRGGRLRSLARKLEDRGTTLTSNTFSYSLTDQKHEGLIDVCKELGVIPFVTDPLDGGLASGVYTATNPSGGQAGPPTAGVKARKFTFKELEKLQPLHSVQETVADRARTRVIREMRDLQDRVKSRYGPPPKINTDITTTQVALNYIIAKGGVPLPEVNSPRQAEEVLGCLGWTLSDEEVDMLDAAVALCNLN